jgi:hypothetical protein
MKDLGDRVLSQIDRDKIEPIPRSHFLLKFFLKWLVISIAVCLGSVAIGIILFHIGHLDHELLSFYARSLWKFFLIMFPLFWTVVVVLATSFAIVKFRELPKGHRYHPLQLLLAYLLLIGILGAGLNQLGLSDYLDQKISGHLPAYESWERKKIVIWNRPDLGLLAGKIFSLESDHQFILTDMLGKNWPVNHSQAIWRGRLHPREGILIKLSGKVEGDLFIAKEVRPWKGRGARSKKSRCHGSQEQILECIKGRH